MKSYHLLGVVLLLWERAGRPGVPRAPFIHSQKADKPDWEDDKKAKLAKAGLGGRRKMLGSSGRGGNGRQKETRGALQRIQAFHRCFGEAGARKRRERQTTVER